MIAMGACAAVIDNGKILLTKREDFEVWCLPGGHVENGESMAQAAVRETLEETGLVIELSHLVSISYRQHNWNGLPMHLGCFAARRTGGQLQRQPEEVLELRYFAPDEIPSAIMSGHRQRIEDAFSGAYGLSRTQHSPPPFEQSLTRVELYALRDRSGLPRAEFYAQHLDLSGDDSLETAGHRLSP